MANRRFYKYGRMNRYSEALFSSNELYFASPSKLNDPFECKPLFTFNGTPEQIMEWHVNMMRKQDVPERKARAIALGTLKSGGYRNSKAWQITAQDIVDKLSKKIGLFCMSKKGDDILMFSHYGDNHKGYCLRFEETEEAPPFSAAEKVAYQEEYPVVDFFNTANDEQFDKIFLTKFTEWSYEQEWRIVEHKNGPGIYSYAKDLLTGVILGMRMENDHKDEIRQWLKARGGEVQLFQAERRADRFALAVKPVT